MEHLLVIVLNSALGTRSNRYWHDLAVEAGKSGKGRRENTPLAFKDGVMVYHMDIKRTSLQIRHSAIISHRDKMRQRP